jgi:hypothetical protein
MAKKATAKESQAAARALRSAVAAGARPEHSDPLSDFMCFRTDQEGVFLKCYWNPVEQRYNRNCERATRAECQGGN